MAGSRGGVRSQLIATQEAVEQHGTAQEKEQCEALKATVEEVIEKGQADLLQIKTEELHALGMRVMLRQPRPWVEYLKYLQECRPHMRDQAAAEALFSQPRNP